MINLNQDVVSTDKVLFAPYNPRTISSEDLAALKRSIQEFQCYTPLIVNRQTMHVVGGNQRLRALQELGHKEVLVVYVDLTLEREKALNLALNKISGDWDEDKLAVILDELTKLPDFDIELSGFNDVEISRILDEHLFPADDDFDPDKELQSQGEPVTKPGDLIILGSHRILCGDSSRAEDVARLLEGKKADLVFTDPPYNVNYSSGSRPDPEGQHPPQSEEWSKIKNDNMPQAEYEVWLGKVFANMTSSMGTGTAFYVWNGHRQFGPMHQLLIAQGCYISCVITWAKERFALGYGDYNQQTEFCLYGWKEDNGAHKWYGPMGESTLWDISRDGIHTYQHPTQKPLALAERAIKNSSKREDMVLDLFLGSGTTLIASEKMGRCCYGMELDPGYCDVIVRRYINQVGPEKVSDELKARYVKE